MFWCLTNLDIRSHSTQEKTNWFSATTSETTTSYLGKIFGEIVIVYIRFEENLIDIAETNVQDWFFPQNQTFVLNSRLPAVIYSLSSPQSKVSGL